MVNFKEAVAYGKWLFGKKFKYATETDDGWLFFMDKNDKSLGEEQTWDEFEYTWNHTLPKNKELQKIYKEICKNYKKNSGW